MPNNGNNFRHALAEYIRGWGEGLAVEEEKYIGWRFIGTPRKLDIVIMNPQNALHGHRGQAPGDQRFGFREATPWTTVWRPPSRPLLSFRGAISGTT